MRHCRCANMMKGLVWCSAARAVSRSASMADGVAESSRAGVCRSQPGLPSLPAIEAGQDNGQTRV